MVSAYIQYLAIATNDSVPIGCVFIAIVLFVCLVVPVLLIIATTFLSSAHRRAEAEARIREAEAVIRENDAALAALRVRVADHIVRRLENTQVGTLEVLTLELLRQTSPAITDLGSKPIVGNVGITVPKLWGK